MESSVPPEQWGSAPPTGQQRGPEASPRATHGRVLVLNATFEPINVCTVRRAVVLLLKEKAELLIFLGSFDNLMVPTILAVIGILLSAGYITWTVQRVFYGPPNERWATLTDTTEWWEMVCMAGLAAIIIGVGVYPATIVEVLESGVTRTLGGG